MKLKSASEKKEKRRKKKKKTTNFVASITNGSFLNSIEIIVNWKMNKIRLNQ